ncbi:hypothetical protein BH23GEM9_BH23GEM9_20460 [soil metagenome]
MSRTAGRAARMAVLAGVVLAFGATAQLHAQSVPTQEGTIIRNKATATFRDAANNDYDAESNETQVTVGFRAGIDVTAPTDVTVDAGSTDNSLAYRMCMTGNAAAANQDWFVVALANGSPPVVTNVRFVWTGTTYANVASLNAALAAAKTAAYDDPSTAGTEENCITVSVLFDAGAGAAGSSSTVTLTATSGRDSNESDDDAATVTIQLSGTISVTPDDGVRDVFRGSSATYNTLTYTLTNSQGGQDGFSVAAALDATAAAAGYTIVSVRCVPDDAAPVAGASTQCLAVPAGGTRTITVVLGVPANAPDGGSATVALTATSQASVSVNDDGEYLTTVIMPVLSMTKAAYGAQNTSETVGTPRPGDSVWYLITITNSGSATASNVVVEDNLPAEVDYVGNASASGSWTSISHASGLVTATLNGGLGIGASASFWINVTVK